ncbi:MAG TPA: MFS transporter [Candidatus Eisenbacteria bacterium]|jgi:MFS family permease
MLLHQQASPTATHARILLFAWLGWLAVFYTLIAFFQLSLLYRVDLGLGDDGVKLIKAVALAATGLGGLALGLLADHKGRRAAMVVSVLVYTLGAAAAGFARSAEWLVACASVAGFGIGGQWAAGQTLLGETVPPRLRGRFGALAQTGAPLGLGLATVVATQLAPAIGWRAAFWLSAAPVLLVPLVLTLVPESDLWRDHRARLARGERADRVRLGELWAPDVRGPFAVAFVLTLFNMANYWFTFSWLPEYLGRRWSLEIQTTGAWTLVFVTGSLTGYLLYGICSDRWGRRRSFSLFSLVMALGLSMITVFEGAIRGRPELILFFIFVAGLGTGTWSGFGPLYTELFPTRVRNTAGGICMNVTRGVQFLAPLLVVAVGGQELGRGVALAAAFAVLAGATVWWLPETRARVLATEWAGPSDGRLGPAGGREVDRVASGPR